MNLTFFRYKFLFIPLLFALLVFLVEKVAGTDSVRHYTETRIEFSFYEAKHDLMEKLVKFQKSRKPEEKLLILFGTSHFGEFSNHYIAEQYPGLVTYNFSAPLAPPSFLYYYLEEILAAGIKVDFAVFEYLPETFQSSANQYALKYSYDWEFMYKYLSVFPIRELEQFSSFHLFHTLKFPVRFKDAYKRMKNPLLKEQMKLLQKSIEYANDKNNGGISFHGTQQLAGSNTQLQFYKEQMKKEGKSNIENLDLDRIKKLYLKQEAEKHYNTSMAHFREDRVQKFFFEKFITSCKEHKINLILLRTFVTEELATLIEKNPSYQEWNKEKLALIKKYKVPYLNLEEKRSEIQCKEFLDSNHLAGACFTEVTAQLIKILKELQ